MLIAKVCARGLGGYSLIYEGYTSVLPYHSVKYYGLILAGRARISYNVLLGTLLAHQPHYLLPLDASYTFSRWEGSWISQGQGEALCLRVVII